MCNWNGGRATVYILICFSSITGHFCTVYSESHVIIFHFNSCSIFCEFITFYVAHARIQAESDQLTNSYVHSESASIKYEHVALAPQTLTSAHFFATSLLLCVRIAQLCRASTDRATPLLLLLLLLVMNVRATL